MTIDRHYYYYYHSNSPNLPAFQVPVDPIYIGVYDSLD